MILLLRFIQATAKFTNSCIIYFIFAAALSRSLAKLLCAFLVCNITFSRREKSQERVRFGPSWRATEILVCRAHWRAISSWNERERERVSNKNIKKINIESFVCDRSTLISNYNFPPTRPSRRWRQSLQCFYFLHNVISPPHPTSHRIEKWKRPWLPFLNNDLFRNNRKDGRKMNKLSATKGRAWMSSAAAAGISGIYLKQTRYGMVGPEWKSKSMYPSERELGKWRKKNYYWNLSRSRYYICALQIRPAS